MFYKVVVEKSKKRLLPRLLVLFIVSIIINDPPRLFSPLWILYSYHILLHCAFQQSTYVLLVIV
jgi:hypothetical protein